MRRLARAVQWIWGDSGGARVARIPLIPLAGLYWVVMKVRATRRRDAARLPLPAIAVGNLSVGGTGKTPLAAWIAEYCAARGRTAASASSNSRPPCSQRTASVATRGSGAPSGQRSRTFTASFSVITT